MHQRKAPSRASACGTQGRVSLKTDSLSPYSFALHTVRAAGKGARPFVRLNRGSAARFALSMGLGYAYGTLEGALLVLVCNGSGRVDGYLTILIATVIAAMNFSLRFEESLGRYGLAVSANVMLVRRRLQ